ncbi:efflux RND transporter periplasmic adaptor subunit [Adhaeribacter swui]|uniref:Efflux RND transporter periplasmic adaptor subunit n=1 Tax=Adhaeribacter swui TaxID=2086471 RepID=A0A7G7GBY8_9BACT|nr:efflux RND transporter periplasmic adaptor subunit [Adhaeribacter swui]QNF34672.1 efflux RND transporter periplasmic adaptor subunit [Adhaeribacter swui]
MKRAITIVIVLVIAGLIVVRLLNNKKEISSKNQVVDNSNVRVTVNVAQVQSRVSERTLRLVGTVEANEVVDVKAETPGKLTSLTVDLGDRVRRGQIIARVDDRTRALSVTNASQALNDARVNLERYRRLLEGGAATQAQFEQYQTAYNNAEIQLAQARTEASNTAVPAPISGQVTQKAVEQGAFVNIGTSLVTIVDVSSLKVLLSVSENDVYALKLGDPVQITATVYPGVTYAGKISYISPRGDEAHNYPVEVTLQNQDKNSLKAGTYVDVAFNRKNQVATLQIPRSALVGSVREAQVYVVQDNKAQLRNITVGSDNGAYLEVLKGLQEGETVVTTGQINLTNNALVAVVQ